MNNLLADESLSKWLRYTYNEMTRNRFPQQSIEDIVNHFKRNGYSDEQIYQFARMHHSSNDNLPVLV